MSTLSLVIANEYFGCQSPSTGKGLAQDEALLVSGFAHRRRQRVVAEVDCRLPDEAAFAVDDEPKPSALVKGEPVASGILIDAALAAAGNCGFAHQRLHPRNRQTKPLGYELGWYLYVAVDETYPGQAALL
jgi:hypothetical protein